MAGFFDKLINRSVTANTGSESESLDEEVAEALVEENATNSETRTLKKYAKRLRNCSNTACWKRPVNPICTAWY